MADEDFERRLVLLEEAHAGHRHAVASLRSSVAAAVGACNDVKARMEKLETGALHWRTKDAQLVLEQVGRLADAMADIFGDKE